MILSTPLLIVGNKLIILGQTEILPLLRNHHYIGVRPPFWKVAQSEDGVGNVGHCRHSSGPHKRCNDVIPRVFQNYILPKVHDGHLELFLTSFSLCSCEGRIVAFDHSPWHFAIEILST